MARPWTCPYDACDGSGLLVDEETRTSRPCRCRPQMLSARRTTSLARSIPKKYRGLSLDRPPISGMPDSTKRVVGAYIRELDDHLRQGRGLWFFGDVGTGKTTLAMLVSQAALDAGHSVAIYSLPRLLAEIRTTFDEDTEHSYIDLLDRLNEVDLLHIDDVGAEKTSPWVLEQLYSIINTRYEEERAVMITTNLVDDEELRDQITPRTVSRLREMCELVPLFGADNRLREDWDDHQPERAGVESSVADWLQHGSP